MKKKTTILLADLQELEKSQSSFLSSSIIFNDVDETNDVDKFIREGMKNHDKEKDEYYVNRSLYLFNAIIDNKYCDEILVYNNHRWRDTLPPTTNNKIAKEFLSRNEEWYKLFQDTKPFFSILTGEHYTIPTEEDYNKYRKNTLSDPKLDQVYDALNKVYGKESDKNKTNIIERLQRKIVIIDSDDEKKYDIILPRCRFLNTREIRLKFSNDNLLLNDFT